LIAALIPWRFGVMNSGVIQREFAFITARVLFYKKVYKEFMAYVKTAWAPRQGVNLNRFTKSQETETSVVLTPDPEEVTVPGTPFSADNMNHIEEGIEAAHEGIEAVRENPQL
jgi:hypothetical protein